MRKNILSPSILSADFCHLGEDIQKAVEGGAEYIHIDVMDGIFVPQISFGMCVQKSIRKCTDKVFDTHLMITEPIRYVEEFASIGSDIITVHLEACEDVAATLKKIRESGCKAGLSIKPATKTEELKPYLELVDMILIMSVEPGFGGQSYIETSTAKIAETRAMIDESGLDIDLEVDGGINKENVSMVLEAGANVIVAGSAVFKDDIRQNAADFARIMCCDSSM
ncbi:MAG: ribulose-phosphate 3-epimerase [Lachnospiraceae bacterium]|nr:ribulose-phosphate 3-epimerase [Lachnospiraceae bacterium]